MESFTERVSKGNVDKLAIILTNQDDDVVKIHVMVKLIGERFAYEAVFKSSLDIMDPDSSTLDHFFREAKKRMREVLEGKKELNVIIT
jgi:hypothetical protein